MSFRLLQFPPQASTRSMRLPMRWMGLDGSLRTSGFLSSWLEDDDFDLADARQVNWGALGGLALSLALSGAFWAGVGILVSHLVR